MVVALPRSLPSSVQLTRRTAEQFLHFDTFIYDISILEFGVLKRLLDDESLWSTDTRNKPTNNLFKFLSTCISDGYDFSKSFFFRFIGDSYCVPDFTCSLKHGRLSWKRKSMNYFVIRCNTIYQYLQYDVLSVVKPLYSRV